MEFNPRRAARVGAKKLRQRQEYRFAKQEMQSYEDDLSNDDEEIHQNNVDNEQQNNS